MADEGKLSLETAAGWAIQPAGDAHTSLVFKMREGVQGVILSNGDMSRFAERILKEAGRLTATQTPGQPPQLLTSDPVPVSGLSIEPHPQDTTAAIVAIQTGNLLLTFSMDLSMLRETCIRFVDRTSARGPIVSH